VELPRGIRLSGRRRVLCLCVQGDRAAGVTARRRRDAIAAPTVS
jgi:hypothetical protein